MGYAEHDIRLPAAAGDAELRALVAKKTGLRDFTFAILKKSLDARRKGDIAWLFRVGVSSPEIASGEAPAVQDLEPERRKRDERVVVVGTGPAGVFAADYLCRAGFAVTVLERGGRVEDRAAAIAAFEAGGSFGASDNYAFGEGGAGTFSDGKLSSRSKGIGFEREYVFRRFIEAGAPDEILYMTHPHLGSDRLLRMTAALRRSLEERGVAFRFGEPMTDLVVREGKVAALRTPAGDLEAERFILATGHSAFETFRTLIARGVPFRPKNFAVGFRAEHAQEAINRAQWGVPRIPGVKAAEYRLAAQAGDGTGVYSFCMCPGGTVVPASAYEGCSVVNGKSDYARSGPFANAAVVAGLSLPALLGREIGALESLDWLEALERSYFAFARGWAAPAMTIRDFLANRAGSRLPDATSYPLGLVPADLAELLPGALVAPLREGLAEFARKLRGYDEGLVLGLESKTSASVQAVRDPETFSAGFPNLHLVGEGSGWSGGIVSSAADGLKAARAIARRGAAGAGTV